MNIFKKSLIIGVRIIGITWWLTNCHQCGQLCNCYEGNPERPNWLKRLDKWEEKQN